MLGGFLWTTGNMLAVPIIKLIGMSMALLIWGSSNMLMGWLTGQFGILGVQSQARAVCHQRRCSQRTSIVLSL